MHLYAIGQHYVMWLIFAERICGYTVYQASSVGIKESSVVLTGCKKKKKSAHLRVRQHRIFFFFFRSTQFNFKPSNSHIPLYCPLLTKQNRTLHYVIPSSHMYSPWVRKCSFRGFVSLLIWVLSLFLVGVKAALLHGKTGIRCLFVTFNI